MFCCVLYIISIPETGIMPTNSETNFRMVLVTQQYKYAVSFPIGIKISNHQSWDIDDCSKVLSYSIFISTRGFKDI